MYERLRLHVPIYTVVYTLALDYPYSHYFNAKVYTTWVHAAQGHGLEPQDLLNGLERHGAAVDACRQLCGALEQRDAEKQRLGLRACMLWICEHFAYLVPDGSGLLILSNHDPRTLGHKVSARSPKTLKIKPRTSLGWLIKIMGPFWSPRL